RRHAELVLRHQPRRREPFAQRGAGPVKHRPGGHRMLPPAAGALENPRPHRELISRPPGAPRAAEALGPAQLRQRRDACRLVPVIIHKLQKPRHHKPLRHLTSGPQDTPLTGTYQEHINLPCLNRIGRYINGTVLQRSPPFYVLLSVVSLLVIAYFFISFMISFPQRYELRPVSLVFSFVLSS